MSLQEVTEKIRTKVGNDSGFGSSLKFDCGNDGVVVINAKSVPNVVNNDNTETDCTITLTLETLKKLMNGELNPTTGFMMGKFKVSGDMSVALKLQRVV